MRVLGSNYKDFYKNPTSGDFAAGLVDLRRNHLNDIIGVGNEFNEKEKGNIQWNPSNFEYLSLYTQKDKAPNIIKIITEDGFEGFFYKINSGAVVNDSKDTTMTINYELNKGDTYLGKKFGQIHELNPYVETLNLHSDILIFYWNLNEIDTTTPLLVSSESAQDIRNAFNQVIGADSDNGQTGDINAYYDIRIDTDAKVFEVIPKSFNDISYLTYTPDSTTINELYKIVEGDNVKMVKLSNDFSVSELSGTIPVFHGLDFDTNGASLYCCNLGGGKTLLQYKSNSENPDDSPIGTSDSGFIGSYKGKDGTIGDLQHKTLIFPTQKKVSSNNIVEYDYNGHAQTQQQTNLIWSYEISPDKSIKQNIIGYRFNILEQKQFGDTNISDNFQLVRKLIGSKTSDELYEYNKLSKETTITLYSYADSSISQNITLGELDDISFDDEKQCYKAIGCKMSALKKIGFDSSSSVNIYESMGGQFQLYTPIGDKEIALLDASGDGLEPETSSVSPTPQRVQFAPFAQGSKMTDATLMDIPNGLVFGLGLQQLTTSQGIFANLGNAAGSSGDTENYAGDDNSSFAIYKFPTNKSISLRISGLDEENSLENKIKTMITNINIGIYDENTEPLFLNPKYFYEAIVYDNSNFIRIDTSGINYEVRAEELQNDGLVLVANLCMNDSMNIFYSFDKNTPNSKIGNNELNILGNNTKTNLGNTNNRTTLELGTNAENLANGGALATYVGYQNYKTKLEQQTMNYDISQAGSLFSGVSNTIGDFAKGNIGGGVKDLFGGGVKLGQKQQNFNMDILNQNRAYNAQISQIKSANAVNVSAPYSTSYGKQDGLFTRYAYSIQDWNKRSKFKEINKNGYFYKDIVPFQRGDNRVYGNALKISTSTDYKYIAQQLQNDDNFGSYPYCEEMLMGLCGGIRIGNINKMGDESNYQNIPKILPPYPSQKIDWRKYFNWGELAQIGIIGDNYDGIDDEGNFIVGGNLRSRVILGLSQHATDDIPSDLLDDMNTDNFSFKYDNGNLTIICNASDIVYLPVFETLGNIIIVNKESYLSRIGNFIINDYQNNKEYFDEHIEYQLTNISKNEGQGDSEDYTYTDINTLHIQLKNTFLGITIIDYTIEKSDSQSVGIVNLWNPIEYNGKIGGVGGNPGICGMGFGYNTIHDGEYGKLTGNLQTGDNNIISLNFFLGDIDAGYDGNGQILTLTSISYNIFEKKCQIYNISGNITMDGEGDGPNTTLNSNESKIEGGDEGYSYTGESSFSGSSIVGQQLSITSDIMKYSIRPESLFASFEIHKDNYYSVIATTDENNINTTIQVQGKTDDILNITKDNGQISGNIVISNGENSYTFGGFTLE